MPQAFMQMQLAFTTFACHLRTYSLIIFFRKIAKDMLKNCNMALNISLERTVSARRPEEYQINNYDTMWSNKLAKVEDIFSLQLKPILNS